MSPTAISHRMTKIRKAVVLFLDMRDLVYIFKINMSSYSLKLQLSGKINGSRQLEGVMVAIRSVGASAG